MKKINYKILFLGVLLFCFSIFIFFEKLSHDNYRYYSAIRASLFDGYFGFFITFIFLILSISIICYGISLDNKFSKLGKYMYDVISKMYK